MNVDQWKFLGLVAGTLLLMGYHAYKEVKNWANGRPLNEPGYIGWAICGALKGFVIAAVCFGLGLLTAWGVHIFVALGEG